MKIFTFCTKILGVLLSTTDLGFGKRSLEGMLMGNSVEDTLLILRDSGKFSQEQYQRLKGIFGEALEPPARLDDGISLRVRVEGIPETGARRSNHRIREEIYDYLATEEEANRLDPQTSAYVNTIAQLDLVGATAHSASSPATKSYASNGVVTKLGQIQPAGVRNESSSFNEGNLYNGIWGYAVGSREYALQCHSSGLHIIDVTNPANPVRVQFIPMNGGDIWRDVETYFDPESDTTYAYVAAQSLGNLFVVNLSSLSGSDPQEEDSVNCTYVDRGETDLGHTLSVRGGLLFLNTARSPEGCRIFDLKEDPWNPKPLTSYSGIGLDCHDSDTLMSMSVQTLGRRDVMFSSDGSAGKVRIVDVTDIRTGVPPNIIGEATLKQGDVLGGAYSHSSALSADHRYLFACDELNNYDISVFDIANPTRPTLVTTFAYSDDNNADAIVHNVKVRGNLLFAAYYEVGLRVFDISNPLRPREVGHFDTYLDPDGDGVLERPRSESPQFAGAWNVYEALPSLRVLVSDASEGLFIFQVDDPPQIEEVSTPSPSRPPQIEEVSTPSPSRPPTTECLEEVQNDPEFLFPCSFFENLLSCPEPYASTCCSCRGKETPPSPSPISREGFNIDLMNMGETGTRYDALFVRAQRRWEEVVIGDLPDDSGRGVRDWFAGFFDRPVTGPVDDILIGYEFSRRDGVGGTLGSASPTSFRVDSSGNPTTTVAGIMLFDSADFDRFTDEEAYAIILHEMGHVLGIGSLWGFRCGTDCIDDPPWWQLLPAPAYQCPRANEEYDLLELGTLGLRLSNDGGGGSACGHWDDLSFPSDIWADVMTPFFDDTKIQVLTTVDIAALEDLGYEVDVSQADAIPTSSENRNLGNDAHVGIRISHTFTIAGRMKRPKTLPVPREKYN